MEFKTENKQLVSIAACLQGMKNDVYVCEDILSEDLRKYIVWAVKDHLLAKKIIVLFENEGKPQISEIFSDHGMYCAAFLYQEERSFTQYFKIEADSFERAKELCRQAVFECMSSEFSIAFLYLILNQDGLNIGQNKRVYLTFRLDLKNLEDKKEADAVRLCAQMLQKTLEEAGYTNWSGYKLLQMKNRRQQYSSFIELYQDIACGERLHNVQRRFWKQKLFLKGKLCLLVKIIKILCIFIGAAALCIFIANLFLGENIFLRLFVNSFEKIGTESLLQ